MSIKEEKMRVRATHEYKSRNIVDAELRRIPEAGEEFEVTEERYNLLHGGNEFKANFVVEVEKKIEVAKKETRSEKAVKKTTKKSK